MRRPPPDAALAETGRVRTDASRDRDELRADLRARAERQADAYRDELAQLRTQVSLALIPGRRGQQPGPPCG